MDNLLMLCVDSQLCLDDEPQNHGNPNQFILICYVFENSMNINAEIIMI